MKLSDYIIEFLIERGVNNVFEVPGGATTHLLDSIYRSDKINCFTMRHEQAASFAAETVGKISGKIGVAMATSGPGATNLITGIGSAYFDSSPALFITGQVNTYEFGFGKVRQLGFQETDIVALVKPITKYSYMVTDPKTIKHHLEKAVYIAENGRPGPVLLDIPMDVQRSNVEVDKLPSFLGSQEHTKYQSEHRCFDEGYENAIVDLLCSSSRPVILAGQGVRISGACDELDEFISRYEIPVVESLMGLDVVFNNELNCGLIGTYGNRYGNLTLANADLIIAIGTRLDIRQTGNDTSIFGRVAKIVHVDIDVNELGNRVKPDYAIRSDAKIFLNNMLNALNGATLQGRGAWLDTISKYKKLYPSISNYKSDKHVNPNLLITKIGGFLSENSVVTYDVGQNQMWLAQSCLPKKGQRFITSGGMGSMGYALPSAIAASTCDINGQIVCICGDGGFQMNIQELETIVSKSLPIKMFVLNNSCLGMVRQFQDFYFGGRNQSTVHGYSAPSFCDIANAYKLESVTIDTNEAIDSKLSQVFESDSPMLIEVKLDNMSMIEPKLLVNEPIEDQHPYLEIEDLKKHMFTELVDRRVPSFKSDKE